MKSSIWFMLVLLLLICGCSSHYTTLNPDKSGHSTIYNIQPDKALEIAQWSLLHTIPGHAVSEINGPMKGYSSYTRFAFDTYAQQVLAIGAKGTDENGKEVCGFYFEVSGQGSSGSGRSYNASIFKNLKKRLKDTGAETNVTNMRTVGWKDIEGCAGVDNSQAALQ